MDQHPIPQDVTGFQFKLIGTMTVKQFGYVASGVVGAVILYYLPLHTAFAIFMKVLLVPLFGVSGVIVAFVPLDGRPIDVMTTNFAKALFSPNQYIYHRQGRRLSFTSVSIAKAPSAKKTQQKEQLHAQNVANHVDEKEEKLRAFLLSSHGQVQNAIDKKEAAFLNALTIPAEQAPAAVAKPQNGISTLPKPSLPQVVNKVQQTIPTVKPPAPLPIQSAPKVPQQMTPSPIKQDDLAKKETELTQALSQAKQEEITSKTPALHSAAEQKVNTLAKQIEEIHAQKQQLEQELSQLKTQLASQKGTPVPAPKAPVPVQPLQDPQHVRTIPQGVTKNVGLPHISDSPNVVVGIVKDPRGNILPNILVEVKDKDNNPVRAFKTNQLGQFASATPLSAGTYNIELDDPKKQHRFDIIQITANNQVLLPIEIISHDAREELRKQLFAS